MADEEIVSKTKRRNPDATDGVEFLEELKAIMYGFGDDFEVREDTLALLNDIVVDYVQNIAYEMVRVAKRQHGVLAANCLSFVLRGDPSKAERIRELVRLNESILLAKTAHEDGLKRKRLKQASAAGSGSTSTD